MDTDCDGWRNLPDGSVMDPIAIMTPPADYDPIRFKAGQMVAENMTAVGINAEVMPVDFDTLISSIDSMEYQMLVLGWHLWSDPIANVFDILGPLSQTNVFGFWSLENSNPYYWELLGVNTLADSETQAMADQVLRLDDLARTTFDVAEQKAYTREAQGVIDDAVPVDVLYYRVNAEAYRTSWIGWVPHLGELLNMFSLSQLERTGEIPVEGSVTIVKGQGSPQEYVAQFDLDPADDGFWNGTLENDGLKGLLVDIYDTSSAEPVLVSSTRLFLGSEPSGLLEMDPVLLTGGVSYSFVLTPLGSAGGSATLTWSFQS